MENLVENLVENFDSFEEVEDIVTSGIFGIIACCRD